MTPTFIANRESFQWQALLPVSWCCAMFVLFLNGFFLRVDGITAERYNQLEEAESLYKQSLLCTASCRGSDNMLYAETSEALSDLLFREGRDEESLSYLQKAIEIESRLKGRENKDTVRQLGNLAVTYQCLGRTSDAIHECEEAVNICRKYQGETGEQTQLWLFELGYLYARQGREKEADQILQDSVRLTDKSHNALDAATIMVELSDCYRYRGLILAAERMCNEALRVRTSRLKATDPAVLESRLQRARLLYDKGRNAEAQKIYRECLPISDKTFGTSNPWSTKCTPVMLALCCARQGNRSQAAPLCDEALTWTKCIPIYQHRPYQCLYHSLGSLCSELGNYSEAERLVEEALKISIEKNREHNPDALRAMHSLADIYLRQGRLSKAKALARTTIGFLVKEFGKQNAETARTMDLLGQIYKKEGKNSDAAFWFQQAFEIRSRTLGSGEPLTMESKENYNIVSGIGVI